MASLSYNKEAEVIQPFNSTFRYLDDLLNTDNPYFEGIVRYLYDLSNIDNPYFEGIVKRIYPPELQLTKANASDTEAPCLDLHFIQNL